jgi:hypothetical protein
MSEDLLGYLLNAVDEDQRSRIEAALEQDPYLRRQFEQLRSDLTRADWEKSLEPPPGLGKQTCDLVHGYHLVQRRHAAQHGERSVAGYGRAWSFRDALMCAALALVAAMLFLPAIANSWFRSNIYTCQRNLQRLGVALHEFSDLNERLFPKIPVSGNRAAAGIYAPILVHHGYIQDQYVLICPSSMLGANTSQWYIPTLEELDAAEGVELDQMRRNMGGSYGYVLGYQVLRRHYPPRNQGRASYALMTDAPSLHLPGRRSNHHLGRGQNVLYEDGRVEFISARVGFRVLEGLYVNRWGYAEAGTDENDSVIGGSDMPPFQGVGLVY